MKTSSGTESAIRQRAERMGYSIHECDSFAGCYFIIDMNSHLVIAGAQEFMEWDEVVRWVVEADVTPTLQ